MAQHLATRGTRFALGRQIIELHELIETHRSLRRQLQFDLTLDEEQSVMVRLNLVSQKIKQKRLLLSQWHLPNGD